MKIKTCCLLKCNTIDQKQNPEKGFILCEERKASKVRLEDSRETERTKQREKMEEPRDVLHALPKSRSSSELLGTPESLTTEPLSTPHIIVRKSCK